MRRRGPLKRLKRTKRLKRSRLDAECQLPGCHGSNKPAWMVQAGKDGPSPHGWSVWNRMQCSSGMEYLSGKECPCGKFSLEFVYDLSRDVPDFLDSNIEFYLSLIHI